MKIELRNLYFDDYFGLKEAMIEAYAGIGGDYWQLDDIKKLLDLFPEGQLCVLVDGKVVASALSIIVDYKKFGDNHTFQEITGNYTFNTHLQMETYCTALKCLSHLNTGVCDWEEDFMTDERIYAKS
jgi:hypothetical protein